LAGRTCVDAACSVGISLELTPPFPYFLAARQELKVAPKGYAKDDPNIDLLRLRSIAVTKACVLLNARFPLSFS